MSNRISIRNSNRYKAAIISIICALVFVGSAVIGIFAATQQNVSTNFSVVYSVGENVAVKVRTESYVPNYTPTGNETNPTTATKDASGKTITNAEGYVVFNAPDAYSEKEVVIPDVTLTPQYPTVEFLYTITNLNEQGYVQYDLLENLTTKTNITTKAYYHTSDTLDNTKSATTYVSTGWVESNLLNLPAGKTTAVKYVLSADDVNQYAEAEGTFGFNLIYTANETREAGTVNKSALIENTATTSAVVFDEYTSETEAAYTGVTLGTGTDISTEQNGTVNLYNVGDTTYVLSHEPIMLPEDSSYMFATDTTNVASVVSMSVRPLATRTAKTRIELNNVNTTMVKNMSNMFAGALVTELDLTSFNPVRVRNMSNMFSGCTNLTKIYVDDTWQTETVTSSKDMFAGCTNLQNFNADVTDKTNAHKGDDGYLSQISVGGTLSKTLWQNNNSTFTEVYLDAYTSSSEEEYVVDGTNVISEVTGIDISEEQDGSVKLYTVGTVGYVLSHEVICFPENSNTLFSKMSSATIIKFNNVDTSNVTNMSYMFQNCKNLTSLDVSNFNTSNVTDMSYMFNMSSAINSSNLTSLDLSCFNTSNVTNMSGMFYGCTKLTSLDLSSFNTSNVTNMSNMFQKCSKLTSLDLSSFNTSKVTNMSYMFWSCSKLTSLDLSEFDTSKVTNMSFMFQNCSSLTSLDLSEFDTSKVTNMSFMFYNCSNLTSLDVGSFNTAGVTNMSNMFDNCSSLTSLDLSSFNTAGVTNMSQMFKDCSNLTSLDLSSFNTTNVTNMSSMFYGCSNLTSLDLSEFDTSKVTNMYYMFYYCSNLTSLDLSGFNTSNVTNMSYMFISCSNLTNIYVGDGWSTANVTTSTSMFYNCTSLPNYNSSVIDKTNAHTGTGGYLTYKAK